MLRRLVEAGKVETVESYHYDDMSGVPQTATPMPVAMRPADWHKRQPGVWPSHDPPRQQGERPMK
jgi:hypothetical protein